MRTQLGAIGGKVLVDFRSLGEIRASGFIGFRSVADLVRDRLEEIPRERGVYLLLRPGRRPPRFLRASPAGHLKGRDPTVPVATLKESWVENTPVLYIGKAGGSANRSTLRSRLRAYLRHGARHRSAHWGGRLVWQLADSGSLLLAWRVVLDQEPREVERELIEAFVGQFGVRPFANRTG